MREPFETRFWKYVQKNRPDECWPWIGAFTDTDYGVLGRGARGQGNEKAHRASWTIHNGPIPDGLFVCHKCDCPACVNPAHLFLGTARDNMHDARRKGRHAHGETASYAKLTAAQVIEIRHRYENEKTSYAKLARDYPVCRAMVGFIIRRERWTHL